MSIATLSEAKDYLNISGDTSHDTELQRFIDAADPVIEDIIGPVNSTAFDEFYDGGWHSIVLKHSPVISVETVTEYAGQAATTLTVAATPSAAVSTSYVIDLPTGILYRVGPGTAQWFAAGDRNVRVQYTAGRSSIPANVKLAALELIRHLYQSTQQSGRPAFGGAGEDQPWAPASFAVPTRVVELLEPYKKEPALG